MFDVLLSSSSHFHAHTYNEFINFQMYYFTQLGENYSPIG